MMKQYLFILLFSCFTPYLFGQTIVNQISVYFKSDKYELQESEKIRIDTFWTTLADKDITQIFIRGNTDSDADSLYNMKLSAKRVISVKKYLLNKEVSTSLLYSEFNGENIPIASNNIADGKQQNRRVDIIIFYREKILPNITLIDTQKVIKIPPIAITTTSRNTLIALKDTCLQDTTIVLPQGTRYTISLCDYYKCKDSIKISEFLTPESILNSPFSTMTTNNELLVTGGMLDVQICEGCKLLRGLKFKVRVPIELERSCEGNIQVKQMSLFDSNNGSRWRNLLKKITFEKINDTLYYTFPITRSGLYNLDAPALKSKSKSITIKFKSKSNIKLVSVRVFYWRSIYEAEAVNGVVKLTLPLCPRQGCNSCIMVKAVGVTSYKDTLISSQCINDYRKYLLFGKCRFTGPGSLMFWAGFVPIRRRAIYKYYFIKRNNWIYK